MVEQLQADALDDVTRVVYLEIPPSKVALFQAHFELYEGVGTVRTLDVRQSLVCVMTTQDMLTDCLSVLESLRESIPWRAAPIPTEELKLRYLGYFKNAR